MNQQLLVPIKGHDQIEELLPYLDDIARPDMKIVFLVHLGVNRFTELAGQLLEVQSGLPVRFSTDTGVTQSKLSHRFERVGRELRDRGVQIEVKFYSGRLKPILRQCIEQDNHHTVIMRSGVTRLRRWLRSFFSALRPGSSRPGLAVRLCHPAHISRR
jgi:hypothetical protein